MRKAVRQQRRRGDAAAETTTIAIPSRGWNARDAISSMKGTDALVLDNWLVAPGKLTVRPGRTPWKTGLPGSYVESLLEYAPASGPGKLFAALPAGIYDATAQGAAGAAVVSGLSNGRWSSVNYATPGGSYLIACNGADGVRAFDGTTWTTQAITGSGLTVANLISVCSHMNRLWFLERATRRVWYLGLQAVTGPATLFDLSQLTPMGGEIVAMDTWTRDGGEGPDDYGVFVTSQGEVLVYAGVSPAADTTWALAGRYRIPRPIGRRCTMKMGAELVILTVQGPLPLSQVMGLTAAAQTNKALTDRIAGAFKAASSAAGSAYGWQMLEHGDANLVVVNVPMQERVAAQQFVFGTTTAAWSRFTGWNASCFGRLNGELYFGGVDGTVQKVTGQADDGQPILATYQHAFTNLGNPRTKLFRLARPKILAPPAFVPAVHVRTRYDVSPIPFRTLAALDTGPAWDATDWDASAWGTDLVASQEWQTVEGEGDTVSIAFRIAATAACELNGTDLVYEEGSIL